MNLNFSLEEFIAAHITKRKQSLLEEDLKKYDSLLQQEIAGKTMLVIGGAGTIGASFIKAALAYLPAKVVVVDINENGLTELVRDCRSRNEIVMPPDFRTYPFSFSDAVFQKLFEQEAPFDIVANFAAHKHVRSEKDMFSIEAMLRNNVIEARKFLDKLLAHPPRHFFCVSTDKAANPVNVMGASKKLMEEVIISYSKELKITTARFANVAFSNGSLLAGFIERMMKKQPLSSPSDVRRYFISPKESGQLCLLACIVAQSGQIVFPQLDAEADLVNFADILILFLKEMGLEVERCASEAEARSKAVNFAFGKDTAYPVYLFASETSGEKSFEEFFTDTEELDLSTFIRLGIVTNAPALEKEKVDAVITRIEHLFEANATKQELVAALATVIPNFSHIEKSMNLDQKM